MNERNRPPTQFAPAVADWDGAFLERSYRSGHSVADEALKLAHSLADLSDCDRVRPLKELAQIGSLETIDFITPLFDRGSSFLRKLARNAVVKIILRTLRGDEQEHHLGLKQKEQLVSFLLTLNRKFAALRKMELTDPQVRNRVYDILIEDDSEFTAQALTEIVRDSDDCVRATAVRLIAEMQGEQETALLVRLLADPDPRVRTNVIESLGALGDRSMVGLLRKYRQDKDNRVRATTLKTLWNLGHHEIMPYLEEMVVDLKPDVRCSAAWLIGEVGHGQKEFKDLLRLLEKDPNKLVRHNVDLARHNIEIKEQGVRVLIAGNDLPTCRKLSYGLSLDGFNTEIATTGQDALALAGEQRPQVLVIDLRLPETNGLQVIRTLREYPWFESAVVIACSDFDSAPLLGRALEAGANTHVIKPCTYDKIKSKLRYFL